MGIPHLVRSPFLTAETAKHPPAVSIVSNLAINKGTLHQLFVVQQYCRSYLVFKLSCWISWSNILVNKHLLCFTSKHRILYTILAKFSCVVGECNL